MGILDIIYPKRCVHCRRFGSYLCADCFSRLSFDTPSFCLVCNKGAVDGLTHPKCQGRYIIDGCFSSILYQGIIKKLIYNFKYKPYLSDLQGVLIDLFYEGIIQKEVFYKVLAKESVFVPIPLHPRKLRERDYNQVELLARGIGRRLDLPVVPLLSRVKVTKSQFGLSREDRLKNMHNAFIVTSKKPTDATIFLIDDIVTSGATLLEAAKVLKKAGYKSVYGLTLAHGQ